MQWAGSTSPGQQQRAGRPCSCVQEAAALPPAPQPVPGRPGGVDGGPAPPFSRAAAPHQLLHRADLRRVAPHAARRGAARCVGAHGRDQHRCGALVARERRARSDAARGAAARCVAAPAQTHLPHEPAAASPESAAWSTGRRATRRRRRARSAASPSACLSHAPGHPAPCDWQRSARRGPAGAQLACDGPRRARLRAPKLAGAGVRDPGSRSWDIESQPSGCGAAAASRAELPRDGARAEAGGEWAVGSTNPARAI